ncbi:MAG: low affinity iron permease family protein [Steroidobacteraceae bacterium]
MTPPSAGSKDVSGGFAEAFRRLAARSAAGLGSPAAFSLAVLVVAAWAVSGPYFHFSETWQLIINTSTTIVTFLMVFLIQNTQNRDSRAIHLKLDELLRAVSGARTMMADLDTLTEAELTRLEETFRRLAHHAANRRETPVSAAPLDVTPEHS